MNGFEFDDVRKEVDSWKGRFANIVCGWPLLTSFEDYQRLPVHCGKNFPIFSRILLWS